MSRGTLRGGLTAGALLALLTLPAAPAPAAVPGAADPDDLVPVTVTVPELDRGGDDGGDGGDGGDGDDGPRVLTNAELRWSLNTEAVSGNYVGCNFFVAGVPGTDGDAGGGRVWSGRADAGLHHGRAGNVRVLRTVGVGAAATQEQATYATRCTGPDGNAVRQGSGTTGAEVVIAGGQGERAADGSLTVRWKGTFTVVFYGGLTYWWAADPVLRLDADGDGTLRATAGGYAADREDTSRWQRLTDTPVTLATFSGERLTAARGGFLSPDYCGVEVAVAGDAPQRRHDTTPCWGSFPQDFVDFQQHTGQSSYWYSSGGDADRRKRATDVAVSYDAAAGVGSPDGDPAGSGGSGGAGGGAGGGGGALSGPGGTGGATSAGGAGGQAASGAGGGGGTPTSATRGAVRPAALAGTEAPTAFTAVAAETLGLPGGALVPELAPSSADDADRLAMATTGLLLTASAAVVGFRRRWLVLPFRP